MENTWKNTRNGRQWGWGWGLDSQAGRQGLSILNSRCCLNVSNQNTLLLCNKRLIQKSSFLHKEKSLQ